QPGSQIQVLWLLHGRGRDHRSLLQLPEVKRQLLASGLWVVLPQGLDGWYVNSPERAEDRFEDHLSELMQRVAAQYALPSSGANWTIAGWSMGGYGAVRYAQQHPERVGRVASVIGLLDFPRPETLPEGQNYRVPQARFGADPEQWMRFNPMRSIEQLRDKSLLLITAHDAFDRTMNENFSRALTTAGLPHRFLVLEGAHKLDVVEKAIPVVLEWITQSRELDASPHSSTSIKR
ncbi:MAG TPA: alpha/beta hydrolase-fold protein, partial [Opitutaceae bacterium]|nr:alpha/beta hydrolase-fold protein [Opitutaceae bacterium]